MEGEARRDVDIYREVANRLEDVIALDTERLSIRVAQGRVNLLGSVDSYDQKQLAEEAVRSVHGVAGVENQLQVESRRSEGAA